MIQFNQDALRPGYILDVRSNNWFPGTLIRKALAARLDYDDPQPWSNHTAIILRCGLIPDEYLAIGETQPPKSTIVPLSDYERDMNRAHGDSSKIWVKVFRPVVWGDWAGAQAALYWVQNVNGRTYNYPAFVKLAIRCIIGQHFNTTADFLGLNSLLFCSEGVGTVIDEAWKKYSLPAPIQNVAPTPYTFEKRVRYGVVGNPPPTLVDVTGECVTV